MPYQNQKDQRHEMALCLRQHDWGRTPLGPIEAWPERFRGIVDAMLLDTVPTAILWGREGILLYNAGYAVVCGERHPRALGCPLLEVWPETEAFDFNGKMLADVLAGESLVFHNACFKLKRNGALQDSWFDLYYSPIVDADGEAFAVKATVIETTEKIIAEQQLITQQNELKDVAARLHGLATASCDVIYRLSPDWEFLWEVDGRGFIKDTQAPYRSWISDYVPEDEQDRVHAAIALAIQTETMYEIEHRVLRVDGSIGWTLSRAVPIRDVNGNIKEWIGAASDISERKEGEHALQESERLFRTVFNSIDEGFCVIELLDGPYGPLSDYVHLLANPAFRLHTGLDDVVGQRVRTVVPEEAEGWINIYRKVLLTGESIRFERNLERTGRQLELAALRIEPAERRQVAVMFKDVTERHRAEVALRDLNDSLEQRVLEEVAKSTQIEGVLHQAQKMEAVGQLTGSIAHDFNNMLAVISNALDLLTQRFKAPDDHTRRYLDVAKGTVTRASQLTQRLLAFSRQQPLYPEPVLVNALVKGMMELLEHSIGHNIVLETILAADPNKTIYVDVNQFENVILNLAVNARDAMKEGGRLTIETASCILDAHFSEAGDDFVPGPYVSIAVHDTGIGMSEEVLSKAFEPFFTTKPSGLGTGLGLSQVYGLVRQSGGHVRIDSAPGKGTVITLYLPEHATALDREPETTPDAVTGVGPCRETILVVDDEPDIRMLLLDMLTSLGYRAFEAEDGTAALQVLAQHPDVQLMITDVLMPGMNGRELAEAAAAQHPGLKVLFMTGYAGGVAIAKANLDQVMDVVDKPFSLKSMAQRVRTLLDHH